MLNSLRRLTSRLYLKLDFLVVQYAGMLGQLRDTVVLVLGMSTLTHRCKDQTPGMDHLSIKCFSLENLEIPEIFFCYVPTWAVAHLSVE